MPQINSGVIITRVEVWVTNRNNTTDQLRNVCAFMDLGENKPYNSREITSNNVRGAQNDANSLWQLIYQNANPTNRQDSSVIGIRRVDNIINLLVILLFNLLLSL